MAPSDHTMAEGQSAAEGSLVGSNLVEETPKQIVQNHLEPHVGFVAINAQDQVVDISDDDIADSEGGMVINIDEGAAVVESHEAIATLAAEDDLSEDMVGAKAASVHSGRLATGDIADLRTSKQGHSDRFIPQSSTTNIQNLYPVSMATKTCLADLSTEDLEQQIKYGLFYLDRDRIDLSRPCVCLYCLQEGHLSLHCPEKSCIHCGVQEKHSSSLCPQNLRCGVCREPGHHSESCKSDLKVTTVPCDLCGFLGHVETSCTYRFFPVSRLKKESSPKLWISCCVCASKTHLVGDCPHSDQGAGIRWSLKHLDPKQITNLSLASGIRGAEMEAENRGMRPKGLQIRGRAGLHQAGRSMPGSSTDEDDMFLRPPVRGGRPVPHRGALSRQPDRRAHSSNSANPSRPYDRFEAPSHESGYRQISRNDWYKTDAFGERRSRSPEPGFRGPGSRQDRSYQNSWRPGDSYERRSPSPRGADNYRPSGLYPRDRRTPSPSRFGTDSYRPAPRNRPSDGPINPKPGKNLVSAKTRPLGKKNEIGRTSMQASKTTVATSLPNSALDVQKSNPNGLRGSQNSGASTPQSVAAGIGTISLAQPATRIYSPGKEPNSTRPHLKIQKRDGKGNKTGASGKDASSAAKKGKRNRPPAQKPKI